MNSYTLSENGSVEVCVDGMSQGIPADFSVTIITKNTTESELETIVCVPHFMK